MFVATVGERPLGIQAGQLAAIARWCRGERPREQVALAAFGPRASMAALVATALEPEAVSGAEVSESLASLKQLIDEDKPAEELPELFAFGLLAGFEVRGLVAMSAPRPVVFRNPSERVKEEVGSLDSWYAIFGVDFSPAR
jgi:hypothetical protein